MILSFKARLGIICQRAYTLSKALNQSCILNINSKDQINQDNYAKIRTKIKAEIDEIKYQLKLMPQTQDIEEINE